MNHLTAPSEPELILTPPSPSAPKVPGFLLVLFFFLFIGSSALAVYFYSQNRPSPQVPLLEPTPTPSPVATPVPTSVITYNDVQFGELTIISPPVEISPIDNLYDSTPSEEGPYGPDLQKVQYFQVGTFSSGAKLILSYLPFSSHETYYEISRLIIDSSGKRYAISNSENITKLQNTTYIDRNFPWQDYSEKLKTTQSSFIKTSVMTSPLLSLKQLKLIENTSFGPLYQVNETKEDKDFINQSYYLKLADNSLVQYSLITPFVTDDRIPQISWSDGTKNTSAYFYTIETGCGNGLFDQTIFLPDSLAIKNLKPAGTTSTGQSISVAPSDSGIVKSLYEQYKVGRDYPENKEKVYTLAEFSQQKTHFLWADPYGGWRLFINSDFAPMAECGKPVIYLYPTKTTDISVKVGADITQSEPTYPISGWNVVAHSDGQLDYQGRSYPNLYWEGTGHGSYPKYFNTGFIVSQSQLLPTVKNHLHQLGLNQVETADFLDFWQSRFPQTPFVRLTWLTTADMNVLAPLTVSPRPDTTIRLFLEFEGLEKPISLSPQRLDAPPRRGFTLVEWGGLLIKSAK